MTHRAEASPIRTYFIMQRPAAPLRELDTADTVREPPREFPKPRLLCMDVCNKQNMILLRYYGLYTSCRRPMNIYVDYVVDT